MCITSTENWHQSLEAYYIYTDQVQEINVPDTWSDLPIWEDFPSDNPQYIRFLLIIDGKEFLIFTSDDAFSQWQAEHNVKTHFRLHFCYVIGVHRWESNHQC